MSEPERWPVVVVGTGAAGMMAALFAARGGAKVLALEGRRALGAKIRVSGGGRCNVLPSRVELSDFSSSGSMNAVRNVLFSWPLAQVTEFFAQELDVPLKVEETGKVFPVSDEAKDIVDALTLAMERAGVTLRTGARVTDVARDPEGFALTLATGEHVHARALVLSTGGLSLPKTGSDGAGMAMARRLGHTLVPTHPALVPLLTPERDWHALAGLSVPATLRAMRGAELVEARSGDLLFTHAGLSGPVALDVSRHFTAPGTAPRLFARFGAASLDWEALLQTPAKRSVAALVRAELPRRLADTLLHRAGVPENRTTSELGRDERRRLVTALTAQELVVSGSEGYRTAEVTAGGVALDEVSAKTLESRVVPGLYLCGEVLDVTGRLGGFNFLWAWTSGRKVGLALGHSS